MATKASSTSKSHKDTVSGLLEFLASSPTPYHAVETMKGALSANGFRELTEAEAWKVEAGGKYFVIHQGSSIVAFRVGTGDPVREGFRFVGAHTDSPCLRVRPNADLLDRSYWRIAAEIYGGVTLSTWFDRDLSIAGRVFYTEGDKRVGHRLVDFRRAVAVVPNLAIHLNRSINENRTIQKQTEMIPVAGMRSDEAGLEQALLELLQEAGAKAKSVVSHDLFFYDTQKPSIVGTGDEFIAGARLDNLASCFAGLTALIGSDGAATSVLVCTDHEEVGSQSSQGAQGPFLKSVVERLLPAPEARTRALSQSILVSTDNAHGIHPNYPEKHEAAHAPILNEGPALKTNTNQRYATCGESAALFTQCCKTAGVPLQSFVARNDVPCGSTIGPITASLLGIRTADVGIPTFAMHSIRELAGVEDIGYLTEALGEFFRASFEN